jgi:hypothetical protein
VLTDSILYLANRDSSNSDSAESPGKLQRGTSNLQDDIEKLGVQGWVWKRGGKNPAFKRRWFILKNNVLKYYKEPPSRDSVGDAFGLEQVDAKGSLECQGMQVEELGRDEEGRFMFSMMADRGTTDRKIICACEDEFERDRWVAKLLQAKKAASKRLDGKLEIIDHINLHEIISVELQREVVNPVWETTPNAHAILHLPPTERFMAQKSGVEEFLVTTSHEMLQVCHKSPAPPL